MTTAAILAVTIPTTREISYAPPLAGAIEGSRTRSTRRSRKWRRFLVSIYGTLS